MEDNTLVFEQPTNEAIRICLRLEQLSKTFNYHLSQPGEIAARQAMLTLLDTLKLANRPDLKSKLTQLLAQYSAMLSQLRSQKGVDIEQLDNIHQQVDQLAHILHQKQGRFGDQLRKNDFLYNISLQTHIPGGVCNYDAPALLLWLNKNPSMHRAQLTQWFKVFERLNDASQLILHVVRHSGQAKKVLAEDGFYQQALESAHPCQLVRVTLNTTNTIYPEISLGRHRLSIRLMQPNYLEGSRPTQYNQTLPCTLVCCQF